MHPEVPQDLMMWLKEACEKGGAFVEQQAPLLANEIVAWSFWSHAAQAAVGTLVALAVLVGGLAVARCSQDRDARNCLVACSVLLSILIFVVAGFGYRGMAKATLAPRLVVVEHILGK